MVICGDLNVWPSVAGLSPSSVELSRFRDFEAGVGSVLVRADTGPFPTRPSSFGSPDGNILDHILGAHVSFAEVECLHEFVHTSDHHPVSAVVRPSLRLPDNSIKYWRLRTERLADKEYYDSYRDAFDVLTEPLQEALLSINTTASVTRSSPQHLRRQLVDRLELKLVSSITDCASSVLGRKKVPVVPYHGKRSLPSHEYLDAKARLSRNYSLLRAFGSLGPEHEVIAGLLTSCDDLKSTLASQVAQ